MDVEDVEEEVPEAEEEEVLEEEEEEEEEVGASQDGSKKETFQGIRMSVTDADGNVIHVDSTVDAKVIDIDSKDPSYTPAKGTSKSNPRTKQKQYVQRYRREWERLEFCKGWLQQHPINKALGFCKYCDRALHARRNDLRKHSICSKHKQNKELYMKGLPIRRSPIKKWNKTSTSMLEHPDLAGWCVKMPGEANRVWCRQCRCSLAASLHSLQTHIKSRKHQGCLNEEPESPPPAGHGDGVFSAGDTSVDDTAGPSGYESPAGGDDGGDRDQRAASPLIESDFAGRVTYSIGLGNRRVGFLGAGQISQAIAQGMLEQGLLLPHDVIVGAPSQRNMMQWKRWKCKTTNNNDEVVRESDIVFVAVKASVLVRMIGRLTPISDGKTRLFISLVPGVTRERMMALLSCRILPVETEGDQQPDFEVTGPPMHVVRCAPNKMMSISAGFCAYTMGEDVPHALYLVVETMFSALGTCVQVEEHLMDAYSTMVASGAAFTCAFVEAMVQGGVSLDMGWDEALKVASAVVSGTSKLLMRTNTDPSALRKSISTPGGSTIAGLAALQRGGLDDAVGKALQLACAKTREVGESVCGGGGGGDTSRSSAV